MGVKRKAPKLYTAVGYSFKAQNEHLSGVVGDTNTLAEWIRVVFPRDVEWAERFFQDDTDAEIVEYMLHMQGLRLKAETARRKTADLEGIYGER